jgi:hypothetical protein
MIEIKFGRFFTSFQFPFVFLKEGRRRRRRQQHTQQRPIPAARSGQFDRILRKGKLALGGTNWIASLQPVKKKKLKKKKATDPHQKELKKLGQLDLSWQ